MIGDMFNWDLEDEALKVIEQANFEDENENLFANYHISPAPSVKSPSPPPLPNKTLPKNRMRKSNLNTPDFSAHF
jgi:hypothetical protein